MLIDFSDLLQVNVFELGHTYLQLVRTLNLRLPPIDPSHHISRFAALLEFGEETPRVAVDATRLVARMDRDWLARGRRPSGICGAALLLAARMNNFRRSVAEIVQVVKIADSTVRKRLEEFKKTGSAALSIGDFRSVWLEEESEPPAFIRGREKEEKERDEREGGGEKAKAKKGKKRKRKRGEDSEDEDEQMGNEIEGAEPRADEFPNVHMPQRHATIDPAVLNEGILTGTTQEPLFLPEESEGDSTLVSHHNDSNMDPLLDPALLSDIPRPFEAVASSSIDEPSPPTPIEASLDAALTEEVSSFLQTAKGAELSEALDDAQAQRAAEMEADEELLGLDEDELDAFILTEEEVRIKERVWVEMNREYLENLAAKVELEQTGSEQEKKKRKKRKTGSNKPRDASTPHGATAAESVRNLIKKNPRYSKRINYDALKDLFDGGAANLDEKMDRDEGLWTMDPDKEDESMQMVIEEGGGGVGITPTPASNTSNATAGIKAAEVVEDDAEAEYEDDLYGEGSQKGEDEVEWEGYEQEA
ncbi:hypothetical protein EW026_g7381 [Hermanssonia centrifuga]|uniref:Cyclin-like domain-containing protein n=1 Tax=Hermanssonia centrifuga TaxID=98765 RepID=A0A4S4K813_9APHY|nr:hypothetical protein EW026_g7381 [Hermanssonia centrifuga]